MRFVYFYSRMSKISFEYFLTVSTMVFVASITSSWPCVLLCQILLSLCAPRAASIVFFSYIGYDGVCSAAEEAINPSRDLPVGIVGSLFMVTILYVFMALGITGMKKWVRHAESVIPSVNQSHVALTCDLHLYLFLYVTWMNGAGAQLHCIAYLWKTHHDLCMVGA